jgi:hypothetical protein
VIDQVHGRGRALARRSHADDVRLAGVDALLRLGRGQGAAGAVVARRLLALLLLLAHLRQAFG